MACDSVFSLRFPVLFAAMHCALTLSQRHVGQALQPQGHSRGWRSLAVGIWLSLASLSFCWANPAVEPVTIADPVQTSFVVEARTKSSRPAVARTPSVVSLKTLPALEKRVYRLIWQGGPFPYTKDGMVFANRERLLPPKTRGFYREYTVASPHARPRGARRIVCGGPRRSPEVCYYTADHYASFRKIVP